MRWKPTIVCAVLFAGFISPRPAHAWQGTTHKELARQSILWMLRSSDPNLRFAGVVIMAAGEGVKAGPTGERQWFLTDEAQLVDIYRDVVLRNEGNTPFLPTLAYDLNGE